VPAADVFRDDDGLWSSVKVPGTVRRRRAVQQGNVVRSADAWPLPVDPELPRRVARLLGVADPTGPGLLALARLVAGAIEMVHGPLAPVADTAGWHWRATPGPAEAPGWEAVRAWAPDLADDVVAILAGPVADRPADLPDRVGARRAATWSAWADRVAARRAAGARLAIRLDAPSEDPGTGVPDQWWLEPLAVSLTADTTRPPVATADPATFGAAAHVWARWLELEAGAAIDAWPDGPPADEWSDGIVSGVPASVDDVLGLLREGAARLADAGIDVLTASGLLRRAKVRRRARATSVGAGLSAASLALTLGVSVDGEELTLDELAELAAAKTELVLVRGRWTRVDDAERARLTRLLARLQQPVSAADLLVDEAFADLEVDPPDALAPGRRVQTPAGLTATLRHYQRDGLDWLTWLEDNGVGGVLADDMGLGKTVQVLARIVADREPAQEPAQEPDGRSGGRGPTLVVCPLTLVDTWLRQAAQFAPDLVVAAYHGPDREDLGALVERADVVLTTYGMLARDEALREVEWHRAVLDEAQAVKNPDTQAARAARALRARHRLAVTGTPVENHLGELWSVLAFASPGILPRRKDFHRVFVRPDVDEADLSRLRVATAPFVLRRTKTDPGVAPELPDRTLLREDCALSREQLGAYEAAVTAMLADVESEDGRAARRLNVLAGISRLKQILVHPAMLSERRSALAGRSGKVDRLVELLDEIVDEGQAAVVFSQFASFVPALAVHLSAELGRPVLTLTGADDRKRRADVVAAFSDDAGPPVLLASLKAGGTGLTLVRANHVVHLDRWWNPAVEDQASDRVWRIGQKQKVFVHTLVCPGTLEDRIDTMLAAKRAVASSVVRSTETRVTELSDAELAELVTLVRERVIS